MKEISLYTDGSAIRPGGQKGPVPGGWAALLLYKGHERLLSGGHRETTANRMELWAIIMGLKALTEPCLVTIYTDSKNAIGWLTGTWRINDDQIKMFKRLYDQVAGPHSIMFHHVPGDDSVELNTKVDRVAKERARTAADLAQLAWVYHDDDGPVETEWPPRIGG